MFYSKCAQPTSLATLWSTCHVLLKVCTASLPCNLVEHLSCFTQSVCDQPLLPPCGALVAFYSKCTQPASLATLWSTCHVLLTLYVSSLSCSVSLLRVRQPLRAVRGEAAGLHGDAGHDGQGRDCCLPAGGRVPALHVPGHPQPHPGPLVSEHQGGQAGKFEKGGGWGAGGVEVGSVGGGGVRRGLGGGGVRRRVGGRRG